MSASIYDADDEVVYTLMGSLDDKLVLYDAQDSTVQPEVIWIKPPYPKMYKE